MTESTQQRLHIDTLAKHTNDVRYDDALFSSNLLPEEEGGHGTKSTSNVVDSSDKP
jgi:hypothetical protein